MIRLQRAAGDQGLRALFKCLSHKKFQFTSLITTEGESGLIIPFDEDTRSCQDF